MGLVTSIKTMAVDATSVKLHTTRLRESIGNYNVLMKSSTPLIKAVLDKYAEMWHTVSTVDCKDCAKS